MWSKLTNVKLLIALVVTLSLVAAIACAAEEEAKPAAAAAPAAAPAAPAAPAAAPAAPAAPAAVAGRISAPVAAPAAAAAPAAPAPARAAPVVAPAAPKPVVFKYVPKPQVEGEFWSYVYDGPRPTVFNEAPMLAELVKQGKLPPLEERIPGPNDVKVIAPADGIGTYGGTWRLTGTRLWRSAGDGHQCGRWQPDGLTKVANVCSWKISEDGRVYTMKIRKGMRWSDGAPFTIEDVRFAWEDLWTAKWPDPISGKEVSLRGSIPQDFKDPVTGNPVKFAVVDDETWTLTYDTPNFNLMESRVSMDDRCQGECFYGAPYLKQFHPKYQDKETLAKMITDGDFPDWTRLFKTRNSFRNNTEMPTIGAFSLESDGDLERVNVRNPYFWQVDPEGNQLPYLDRWMSVRVENREVAVFRTMKGETDFGMTMLVAAELPLYIQNAEKGGYSIRNWFDTGGVDAGLSFNTSYNEDPEIGKWMRTKAFRNALSLAIDRNDINTTIFLGLGQPRQMIPAPSFAYYPGPEYETKDVARDVAKANRLLDSIGLTAKDSEGFRLRTDGSGDRLILDGMIPPSDPWPAFFDLIGGMWADVGIDFTYRTDSRYYAPLRAAKEYIGPFSLTYAYANPWYIWWGSLALHHSASQWASEIGMYAQSAGEQGSGRTGPDPSILPLACTGCFPTDVSGNLGKLFDLYEEGLAYPSTSAERLRIGQEIFKIHSDEKYIVGTVGFAFKPAIVQNNFKNVPLYHVPGPVGHAARTFTSWAYYFENGEDNLGR